VVLRGLAAIHHHAAHREADLEDASGALDNVLVIALADGRVGPVLVAGSERPRQLTLGWWDLRDDQRR
jgi:hypothetical protein